MPPAPTGSVSATSNTLYHAQNPQNDTTSRDPKMEDNCATCTRTEIDLWSGYGTARGGILKCEDNLTVSRGTIVVSPASNLPIDTTPIWNEATKRCQPPY